MRRILELYISGDRVDLFDDESISITDSIKNIKDISKVFTTFSKQFSVPASRANNKIFSHYYNYDITNGFDARFKVDAEILINSIPYKKGKIKLDGVKMKNNKAHTYKLTFYGSTVELKDVLGEDKLFILDDLDAELSYDGATMKTQLTSTPGDYCVPLITHSQLLYYDSGNPSKFSGNLYDSGIISGVDFLQLKYGVRLKKIIDAIENQYSQITFAASTFFKPSSANVLSDLYMWLHRKKDVVEPQPGNQTRVPFTSQSGFGTIDGNGDLTFTSDPTDRLYLIVVPTNLSFKYDLVVYKNDAFYARQVGLQGVFNSTGVNQGEGYVDGLTEQGLRAGFDNNDKMSIRIEAYERDITIATNGLSLEGSITGNTATGSGGQTASAFSKFNAKANIPDMKIIDFLSGIFKMFNLVAYVNDDNEIVTESLDDFYSTGVEHDITEYVDVTEGEVNVALPYKEIFFKYSDTKTILANQHLQELSDVEWGGVEYTSVSGLSGGTYKVELPFHHLKYERLIDRANTDNVIDVTWGYFVDDSQNPYLGKPLIFYAVPQQPGVSINFRDRNGNSNISATASINMPSNSKSFSSSTSTENIHFNPEFNEFAEYNFNPDTQTSAFTGTLFENFYSNYITDVFDANNRLTAVTAYLPLRIIRSLTLADILVIQDRKYRINSITTDLMTGKSKIELLND